VLGAGSQFCQARLLPVGNSSDNLALFARNIPAGETIANNYIDKPTGLWASL
jgi:hypothetical protein